jgi:alkanesulfonate monooxygenase SsuD/methylene tetrahydromethanopterin reductase-like flavin-dependent oxidoreductase (luciferase family)
MAVRFGVALDFGSRVRPLQQQLERQAGLLRAAEDAGFELVAAGESSSAGSFHLPNPLQVLAAITLRTRLHLCTGIALLPAWDPWKLALDTAQLDQLSGGRFVLGVGIGSAALQARAGWPPGAISEHVDAYLTAIRALWSGATEVGGDRLHINAGLPIRPTTPDGPPIWVGGAVRRSAVRAARLGGGWYAGINYRLSALPRMVSWYSAALARQGNPAKPGAVVVNRLALAARSPSSVHQLTDRYLTETVRSYAGGDAPDATLDDIGLVGTPDQIVGLAERYRAAGVTHIFARLSMDEVPSDIATQTIELFGRHVIPRLQ